jgi:predicted metal-dependent HD superfamily phosphohydrolase
LDFLPIDLSWVFAQAILHQLHRVRKLFLGLTPNKYMPSSLEEDLLIRWAALAHRAGLQASDLGRQIVAAYAEPHRVFHGPAHLLQVLARLEEAGADDRLLMAAWFHDVVYRPGQNDNEDRSAELAEAALGALGYPEEASRFVCDAIRATAKHAAERSAFDLLFDADLSVLGESPESYERYRKAIRREYAAVPDDTYRNGRAEFLRQMLARPAIYRTPRFRDRFEAAARENLAKELAHLQSAEGPA